MTGGACSRQARAWAGPGNAKTPAGPCAAEACGSLKFMPARQIQIWRRTCAAFIPTTDVPGRDCFSLVFATAFCFSIHGSVPAMRGKIVLSFSDGPVLSYNSPLLDYYSRNIEVKSNAFSVCLKANSPSLTKSNRKRAGIFHFYRLTEHPCSLAACFFCLSAITILYSRKKTRKPSSKRTCG